MKIFGYFLCFCLSLNLAVGEEIGELSFNEQGFLLFLKSEQSQDALTLIPSLTGKSLSADDELSEWIKNIRNQDHNITPTQVRKILAKAGQQREFFKITAFGIACAGTDLHIDFVKSCKKLLGGVNRDNAIISYAILCSLNSGQRISDNVKKEVQNFLIILDKKGISKEKGRLGNLHKRIKESLDFEVPSLFCCQWQPLAKTVPCHSSNSAQR